MGNVKNLGFSVDDLFDVSPNMLGILSGPDQAFVMANNHLCDALGCSEDELEGQSLFGLVHPADLPHCKSMFGRGAFSDLKVRIGSDCSLYLNLSGAPVGKGLVFLTARDITKDRARQNELYRLAHFDSVTGLPNRHLFKDRITQGLAQARREERHAALIFLDLDNFKPINDTYGHAVGDQVLKALAQQLLSAVRDTDTVSRIGGDEFVVFLSMLKKRDLVSVVQERLYRAIQQPVHVPAGEINVSASCGIAVFPDDGTTKEELMRCADERMYKQKATKQE